MKTAKWLRKSLVVLVSILTFGLISPADLHWLGQAENDKNSKKDSIHEAGSQHNFERLDRESPSYIHEPIDREMFVREMLVHAERNSYVKFGGKIGPKIQDEFKGIILPKMEEAIDHITLQFPEEKLMQLAVSEKPAAGRGEKIFHIYNEQTNEDIIRFHVRQENPPQEGYWFNFHYHTHHDQFLSHYELGKIYWDKNTPPRWGSTTYLS
ncbi:hypothetical protein ELQ35_10985 [Peribacillus cavernae]|uniref:Cell division protein FtsK n=1 Tax=Peribacillus cavernae TaxID=1674310 RepID=A0A433HLI7_9BACI|nr:YpjP family protein [Peribacillus cavernae]MDQ0217980.1 hypothetical protein [Peribacillus cavernae]RUQ28972.1 hypothetical protein ELQ35_10985 [Peribacillus cavernae]